MRYQYKNESLEKIAKKYEKDLSDLDDVFFVPVGAICERIDIDVKFHSEAGLSGRTDGESAIIVNKNLSAGRMLFTIAHELGHCVLHSGLKHRFDKIDKYNPDEKKEEIEANDFAGELIMPKIKFCEKMKECKEDIEKVSDFFMTSILATKVRAFNLGLIESIYE